MDRKEEIIIASGLFVIFGVVVLLSFFDDGRFLHIMLGEFEDFFDDVGSDDFLSFAITVEILYELLPQTAQVLGLGAITTRLLSTGINPFILGLLTATARLGGQMILYAVGRFVIARFVIKNKRKEASTNHFMHKYHYVVFLFPAWLGAFGDLIMLTAGHQKINPIKMIPFLFAGNLADAYKWIFWDLGQIEVANSFTQ